MEHERLNVLVYLREDMAPYRDAFAGVEETVWFCQTEDEVAERIARTDVIFASIGFPADLLGRAVRLQWIQVNGAGIDRFLVGARLPDSVRLTRAADVGFGEQMAEYVIGHLLARTQRIDEVRDLQSRSIWRPLSVSWLAGRTIGVAGTGSIGRVIGDRARGMGMRVLGYARTTTSLPEFERIYGPSEWTAFLRELDVLVLALPLTHETKGLVGPDALRVLHSDAVLVNVARGEIVDQDALICALRDGAIGGAILDVFPQEPLPPESSLWGMPNVIVTAHHSGLNRPARMAEFFLDNLERFRAGQPLSGEVDRARGY